MYTYTPRRRHTQVHAFTPYLYLFPDIPGQDLLAEVITGVAIADTDSLSVYFGCVSEPQARVSSLGGAGLLRISGSDILPLRSNTSMVYAGSMFVTDACNRNVQSHSIINQGLPLFMLLIIVYINMCFTHVQYEGKL